MDKLIFNGFSPLIWEDSEILILGSFPSVKSRENNFYYGNKQNRFWKTLAEAFNEKLPISIDDKVEICRKHKIALWDVYCQSDLSGSSDLKLSSSNSKLSDIQGLLKKYKNIKKILCNGALSYKELTNNFSINLPIVKLKSTSPACVRFNKDEWIQNLTNT